MTTSKIKFELREMRGQNWAGQYCGRQFGQMPSRLLYKYNYILMCGMQRGGNLEKVLTFDGKRTSHNAYVYVRIFS